MKNEKKDQIDLALNKSVPFIVNLCRSWDDMTITLRRIAIMGLGLLAFLGCAGTPPTHLGIHNGQLAACPSSPNCVSSYTDNTPHSIAPLTFTGDPDAAFSRLRQILERRKDTIIIESAVGYLRVELRTILFVDDAEFLLDRDHGVIHVRSASRLGYSDLGKNRRRIEELFLQFRNVETP
jgi:uncharacterized protein (DUF1499 family)